MLAKKLANCTKPKAIQFRAEVVCEFLEMVDSRGLSQNQATRTRLTEYSACIAVCSHWLLSILDKAESFVTVALKLNNDHHLLTSPTHFHYSHLTLDDAPLIKDTPHVALPSPPTSSILLSGRQPHEYD